MCLRGLVRICVTESLPKKPPKPLEGLGGLSFYLSLGCFKLYAIRTSPPLEGLGEAFCWLYSGGQTRASVPTLLNSVKNVVETILVIK